MKIVITGYSGSGKSTLCRMLCKQYRVPALHMDTVQFLPGWEIRTETDKQNIVSSFLDSNPDGWVIDGNYSKLSFERRAAEADIIIQMLFGRISCLLRCVRRYRRYKGKSRPDMTEGCNEKLDFEFVKWILWEGRSKKIRNRYKLIRKQYPEKAVVIKNQRQLDAYLQERDY